jgi:Mce-associated membrane protein
MEDEDAMRHPNPATLEDVRADPTPDQEADDTGETPTGSNGAGPEPSAAEATTSVSSTPERTTSVSSTPEPPGPERATPPAVVPKSKKGPSSEGVSAAPKAKKKSKKQLELRAEILGLEAQIRDLEAEPARGRTGARRRLVVPIVAGVVIVALAIGLVLTSLRVRQADATSSARTSAVASAMTYAVELSSYDYRHLTVDFGIVTAHSTPSFAKTFIQQSDALKPVLAKYKATAKATVDAVGLTSGSTNRAVVLVIVSQTVSNSVKKAPTTDRSQVSLTLVRQHGHWLIDNAQLL